jgi:hypothetical protein
LRKYSHREASKLIKQKAALKKQQEGTKKRAVTSRPSVNSTVKPSGERHSAAKHKAVKGPKTVQPNTANPNIPQSKPIKTVVQRRKVVVPKNGDSGAVKRRPVKKHAKAKRRTVHFNMKTPIIIGAVLLVCVAVFFGLKYLDIDVLKLLNPDQKTQSIDKKESQQKEKAVEKNVIPTGVKTDFVRNQINSNMIINSSGNFVSVENTQDYHFMDMVFRETTADGQIVEKKVIESEYTIYTYVAKHCEDIIEIDDGYMIVGYAKRGDYARGSSDVNAWVAKLNAKAQIVWEKTFDDGFKKGKVLSIEKSEDDFRLFVEYEALKNSFVVIDKNGEVISEDVAQEELVTFDDTADGGKILLKKQNSVISVIKKVGADDTVAFEKLINGHYTHIFSSGDGYLLFGEKEVDRQMSTVVTFVDGDAQIVWEKNVSKLGLPKINNVKHVDGVGYFLTGYAYSTVGKDGPRQKDSLFDSTVQDIQDAWVAKLNEDYTIAWEKTYAYGDMGSYFHDIMSVGDNEYYLLGTVQYQGKDAAMINQNDVITGITDNTDMGDDEFVDLADTQMTESPVVNDVVVSVTSKNITNNSLYNDFALKVYWTSVAGAKNYAVNIFDKANKIYSTTTSELNSVVIEDAIEKLGITPGRSYNVQVVAIDEDNNMNESQKLDFSVNGDEYAMLRTWYLDIDFSEKTAYLVYKTCADYRISGAGSVNVSRVKVNADGSHVPDHLSSSSENEILDDFRALSFGNYFYRMEIVDKDGVKHTMDSETFEYRDIYNIQTSTIVLDESRLMDEVGLNDSDIDNLKRWIYIGDFEPSEDTQVKLLQMFCNYYLGDLAKLGIYSPDTEPQSGFDIPIAITGDFGEDTSKGIGYLLAYFGRYGVDGERITRYIDRDFVKDIAMLSKRPLSNDIIASFRYDGMDSKYNAGYTFDTKYNIIEGLKFAIPVDHQPLKSAYFGIRYLPMLKEEEYDSGVRLHAGLDFRCEDFIIDDLIEEQRKKKEEYIDTDDQVEVEEVVIEKSKNEIRRDRIYALYDGVVVTSSESIGNGLYIMIKHVSKDARKEVFYTQYLHLSSRIAQVGQVLKRGEILGTMGDTGYSGGKHLHVELFTPEIKSSAFLNPLIYEFAYPPLMDEAVKMEIENGLISWGKEQ